MVKPVIDESIDLPAPPLCTGIGGVDYRHAPIIAHFLDEKRLRGKLSTLNLSSDTLSIETLTTPPTVKNYKISELRYLVFTEHAQPQATDDAEFPAGLEFNKNTQAFKIQFFDRKVVTGNTFGYSLDRGGLHLYQPVADSKVVRLFVPVGNIADYQIGPLIGKELSREKLVSEHQIDHALKEQEKLKEQKLGEYLLSSKAVNKEQLQKALDQQSLNIPSSKNSYSTLIGQLLLEYGWITPQQLEAALNQQKKDHKKKLGEILISSGAIDAKQFYIALSRALGIPFVDLKDFDIEEECLAYIPPDIARRYNVIPVCLYHDHLVVAMTNPHVTEAIDVIQFISGRTIEPAIATDADIDNAISKHYIDDASLDQEALAAEENSISTIGEEKKELKKDEIEQLGRDKPIVRLVNRILLDAIRRNASDIHVRPLEEGVDLIFRIDGSLINVRHFSKGLLTPIISRIKIIGAMDIAEHRVPQDGRARITDNKAIVDLRISIMPTINGESAVIRLLNAASGLKKISDLGFNKHDGDLFTDLLHKSYGMILVTGPTGSGKSTTLYAALQEIIDQNVNIITIENPVEYHIDGIEQIQINTQQGYTFARALRNILRHDPDVIMVGEIRDQETGQIAIESALTGHLVLSTLHTNDAAGAVTRLLEMGIAPFLLNAALLGILAQRLVRRNCDQCIDEEAIDPTIRKLLGVSEDEVFYKGKGCEHCNGTGYSGRLAVYELLKISPEMKPMIIAGESSEVIHKAAVKGGMTPLTENALAQARKRATSLMEVYRVRLE